MQQESRLVCRDGDKLTRAELRREEELGAGADESRDNFRMRLYDMAPSLFVEDLRDQPWHGRRTLTE